VIFLIVLRLMVLVWLVFVRLPFGLILHSIPLAYFFSFLVRRKFGLGDPPKIYRLAAFQNDFLMSAQRFFINSERRFRECSCHAGGGGERADFKPSIKTRTVEKAGIGALLVDIFQRGSLRSPRPCAEAGAAASSANINGGRQPACRKQVMVKVRNHTLTQDRHISRAFSSAAASMDVATADTASLYHHLLSKSGGVNLSPETRPCGPTRVPFKCATITRRAKAIGRPIPNSQ
jgi:hypothetical protein